MPDFKISQSPPMFWSRDKRIASGAEPLISEVRAKQ
jgi:hypothetical protein